MELSIIRRETTGAPPNVYNESETITKFEIMDGAPVRGTSSAFLLSRQPSDSLRTGETIPIRLFLGGFELTPTFRDVNKKFSTRYYLNLVLVDEENRRYFKSSEITIFRCVMACLVHTDFVANHLTFCFRHSRRLSEFRELSNSTYEERTLIRLYVTARTSPRLTYR
jgi:hypothetical protein